MRSRKDKGRVSSFSWISLLRIIKISNRLIRHTKKSYESLGHIPQLLSQIYKMGLSLELAQVWYSTTRLYVKLNT